MRAEGRDIMRSRGSRPRQGESFTNVLVENEHIDKGLGVKPRWNPSSERDNMNSGEGVKPSLTQHRVEGPHQVPRVVPRDLDVMMRSRVVCIRVPDADQVSIDHLDPRLPILRRRPQLFFEYAHLDVALYCTPQLALLFSHFSTSDVPSPEDTSHARQRGVRRIPYRGVCGVDAEPILASAMSPLRGRRWLSARAMSTKRVVTAVVIEFTYKSTFPTRRQRAVPRVVTQVWKGWEINQKRRGFPNFWGVFPNFSGEFPNLFLLGSPRSRRGLQATLVAQQFAQAGTEDGLWIRGRAMGPYVAADALIKHLILVGDPNKVGVWQLLRETPNSIGALPVSCHEQDAEAVQLAAPFVLVSAVSVARLVGLIVEDLGAQVIGLAGGTGRRLTAHVDLQEEQQMLVLLLAGDAHHGVGDKVSDSPRYRGLSCNPGTIFITGQQRRGGGQEVATQIIASADQSSMRDLTPVLQQLMGHHAWGHGTEAIIGDGAFDKTTVAQDLNPGRVECKYIGRSSGGGPHGSGQHLQTPQLSQLFQRSTRALFGQPVKTGQLRCGQHPVHGHCLQQLGLLGRELGSLHQITSLESTLEECDGAADNSCLFRQASSWRFMQREGRLS